MVETARKTHSRTPNYRCETGLHYRKNAGNTAFTGFFGFSTTQIIVSKRGLDRLGKRYW